MENVYLKNNQNRKATATLFAELARQKPKTLYLLGDVVSLGYQNGNGDG